MKQIDAYQAPVQSQIFLLIIIMAPVKIGYRSGLERDSNPRLFAKVETFKVLSFHRIKLNVLEHYSNY